MGKINLKIFFVVLILFLSIAAVSAADDLCEGADADFALYEDAVSVDADTDLALCEDAVSVDDEECDELLDIEESDDSQNVLSSPKEDIQEPELNEDDDQFASEICAYSDYHTINSSNPQYYFIGDSLNIRELWIETVNEDGSIKYIDGNIDVYVNDVFNQTVFVSGAENRLTINGLTERSYTIGLVYNGTETYAPDSLTMDFTRYEKKSFSNSTVGTKYPRLGYDVIVDVNLTSSDGIIDDDFQLIVFCFPLQTVIANYTVNGGRGTVTIPSSVFSKRGDYELYVEYLGNEIYSPYDDMVGKFFVESDKWELSLDYSSPEEVYENSAQISISIHPGEYYYSELVDVYLNGEFYETVLTSDKHAVNLTIENLKLGSNTIKLVLNETDFLKGLNRTFRITYLKIPTETHVSYYDDELEIYEELELGVSVSYMNYGTQYLHQGYVDIYVNGVKNTTVDLSQGQFIFKTDTPGEYNITGVYLGDDNYEGSTSDISTIIVKYVEITPTISIGVTGGGKTIDGVYYHSVIPYGDSAVLIPSLRRGYEDLHYDVDIYVNGSYVATTQSGQNYYYMPQDRGIYNVTAKFNGAEKYTATDFSQSILVYVKPNPTCFELSSDVQSIELGDSITINYDIFTENGMMDNIAGTVVLYYNSSNIKILETSELSGSITLSPRRVGKEAVRFVFISSSSYYEDSNPYNITFDVSENPDNRIPVELTLSLRDEDPISNSYIVVSYPLSTESSIDGYTVYDLTNETQVQWYFDGEFVENTTLFSPYGVFMFQVNDTGMHNLTAVYEGNSNLLGTTSTLIFNVKEGTQISYKTVAPYVDELVDIEFEVLSSSNLQLASGFVEVYVNGVLTETINLADSSIFKFTPAVGGRNNITFKYLGDETYNGSSATYYCYVKKYNTTMNVSYEDAFLYYGESKDIILNVSANGDKVDRGSVEVYDNNVLIDTVDLRVSNVFHFAPKEIGRHEIFFKYVENDKYLSSDNTQYIFLFKALTELFYSIDKYDLYVNETANIKISLTANGKELRELLDVYVDDVFNTTIDLSQTSTFQFSPKKAGNYVINFVFKGDDHMNSAEISVCPEFRPLPKATKIVCAGMTTTAIDTKVDGKKGQYFSVTLKDSANKVLANKVVQLTLNKVTYKVKTNAKGVAKFQINIAKAGTYTANIKFAGDSAYVKSSASVKIKVNKQKPKLTSANKSFKSTVKTKKLTAKLTTSRGKVLKGQKISFTVNRKTYTAKTNSKGIATVTVKLTKKGKYTCNIKYAGTSTYSAITKKIAVTIK